MQYMSSMKWQKSNILSLSSSQQKLKDVLTSEAKALIYETLGGGEPGMPEQCPAAVAYPGWQRMLQGVESLL